MFVGMFMAGREAPKRREYKAHQAALWAHASRPFSRLTSSDAVAYALASGRDCLRVTQVVVVDQESSLYATCPVRRTAVGPDDSLPAIDQAYAAATASAGCRCRPYRSSKATSGKRASTSPAPSSRPAGGLFATLGMIIVNLLDKQSLAGIDGGFDNLAWRARLFLFLGFALLAGGLAGSIVRSFCLDRFRP
jgi:hypothetical protein